MEFESIEQMADATAESLAEAASGQAFHLFQENKFRHLAKFEQLDQTEHDRIFNELVLAYLIIIMLVHEAPDLRISEEQKEYLKGLSNKIPDAYLSILRDLGIGDKHLKDWKKLIALRYEEYAQDRHEVRAASMEIASSEGRLDMDGLTKIQMIVPVQAVVIGCHHHICRGKTEGYDDLFKVTLRALSRFYVNYRIRIEGGKITFWIRVRIALRRLFSR